MNGESQEIVINSGKNDIRGVKIGLPSSIDKAYRLLNFKSKASFHDGLVMVNAWFEANWNNILKDDKF